jgi:SpoVK/Ycf46/Vps4 family AAA+-type ATPase
MKKPLYSIQSSQLGISVLDIESNLNKILYRAEKWGAILLIDEADAYIYKRGNDILQNCIVGTFLRLLEYYNGVLFLTSNRPEIIDDAIMSRVTLHIKFEKPTEEEFHQLWSILSENMSLESNLVDKLLTTYEIMSGRDIRNLLKNIKKCFSESSEVKFEMIEELEDMLPFIERKNTFLL